MLWLPFVQGAVDGANMHCGSSVSVGFAGQFILCLNVLGTNREPTDKVHHINGHHYEAFCNMKIAGHCCVVLFSVASCCTGRLESTQH